MDLLLSLVMLRADAVLSPTGRVEDCLQRHPVVWMMRKEWRTRQVLPGQWET